MTSLSESLRGPYESRQGLPCPMVRIFDELKANDPDAAVALEEQLLVERHDPERKPTTYLAKLLTDAGYPIHYKSIEKHRAQSCRCFSTSRT